MCYFKRAKCYISMHIKSRGYIQYLSLPCFSILYPFHSSVSTFIQNKTINKNMKVIFEFDLPSFALGWSFIVLPSFALGWSHTSAVTTTVNPLRESLLFGSKKVSNRKINEQNPRHKYILWEVTCNHINWKANTKNILSCILVYIVPLV